MSSPAPLPSPASAELVAQLRSIGARVDFRAGQPVLQQGQTGTGIYLLLSGSLTLSVSPQEDLAIPLRAVGPGSFVGLSSTLSCDHCCYTVKAVEDCELVFVSGEAAQELLRSRPDLCLQVIQLLGQEMNSVCAERAFANTRLSLFKSQNESDATVSYDRSGIRLTPTGYSRS